GDDAMALGRVLLENAVLLEWLLLDPVYRLDLYCLSDALFRRRWLELTREHYQHRPDLISTAEREVDADVFGRRRVFRKYAKQVGEAAKSRQSARAHSY